MTRIDPDPLLPAPTAEQAAALGRRVGRTTEECFRLLVAARKEQIELRTRDPFDHGFVPKIWTVVWCLLDWPYWPKSLEAAALAESGEKDLWAFMARMRRALGFDRRCNMVWVSGANRSGKSELMAYMTNAQMAGKENQRLFPMSSTHDGSIQSELQKKLWRYIPPPYREIGKGKVGSITFSEKNGFTESSYIFPNGSRCSLLYYSQEPTTAGEGFDADAILPDETIPGPWFERIGPRINGRGGWALLTNTPQAGYTDVVQLFLNGATVTRWAPGWMLPMDRGETWDHAALGLTREEHAQLVADADARPPRASTVPESRPEDCWAWLGEESSWRNTPRPLREPPRIQEGMRLFEAVPRVARCEDPDRAVVWFHSGDNPFSTPRVSLRASLMQDRDWTRCRLYGVVSPSAHSVFVGFRRSVHVVPRGAVPRTGTRYMVIDPAFARNAFILWMIVVGDTRYIYREFPGPWPVPEKGVPGAWAKTSGKKGGANDGAPDEGSASFGWGFLRYKNLIARVEGWREAGGKATDAPWDDLDAVRAWTDSPFEGDSREPIARRLMDPRGGQAKFVGGESTSTPFLEYAAIGMRVEPAFSGDIDDGIAAITDALDLHADGKPRLYVSEDCPNTIYAFENWKWLDGEKGATKDPIDNVRYLHTSDCIDLGGAPLPPAPHAVSSASRAASRFGATKLRFHR